MSLELFKSNIKRERELITQIEFLFEKFNSVPERDIKTKKDYNTTVNSKLRQINILNKSIPDLISGISLIKKIPNSEIDRNLKTPVNKNLISLKHNSEGQEKIIGMDTRMLRSSRCSSLLIFHLW